MRHSVFVWIGLLVVAWITLGIQQVSAQGSVESDRAVLIGLYDSAGGDNWHNNTNWKSDKPLGEWYGVTTNEEGRVDSLLFRNNNLTGRIPVGISTLDNLEMLHFGDNTLFGNIPSEIGELKNIKDIRFYNNSLHGPIPSEIGKLDSLRILLLDGNTLSGIIPSEIGNFLNMEYLYLFNNFLSGIIPPEIGNLNNLIQLRLQENILTGSIPSEIGRLSNLKILLLYNNLLSGPVPLSFAKLSLLQRFLAGGSVNNICVPTTLAGWYNTIPYRDDVLLSVCPDPPTSSETEELPATFSLEQNYPNPFNPSTTIEYALDVPGYVELSVYSMAGVKVTTLVREYQTAGRHTVVWYSDVSSGTYLYRLVADGHSTTRYMTLVR